MAEDSKNEELCFNSEECAEIAYNEVLRKYDDILHGYATFRERAGSIIGFIGVVLTLEFLAIGPMNSNHLTTINYMLMNLSNSFFLISLVFAALSYRNITFNDFEIYHYPILENMEKKQILEKISFQRLKFIETNDKRLCKRRIYTSWALYNFVCGLIVIISFMTLYLNGSTNILNSIPIIILLLPILILIMPITEWYIKKQIESNSHYNDSNNKIERF